MLKELADLLVSWKVDLVISGFILATWYFNN